MRPKSIIVTMTAADDDALATAQNVTASGSMSLTGVLTSGGVATMDVPRHLSILSTANESALTFTVAGTNRYDAALTETVTGPNNTASKTTQNFKTVTSISIDSATVSSTVKVGTSNSLQCQWIPTDYRVGDITVQADLSSTASMTYVIQHTNDNVWGSGFDEISATTFDDTVAAQVSGEGGYDAPIRATRVSVTNFLTGTLTYTVLQRRV